MKIIKTKTKKNIFKALILALGLAPISGFAAFATSCSHVINETSSHFETTKINVDNTNIIVNATDKIKFTDKVDNVWNNIDLFKEKITEKNILSNIKLEKNDICIPYSSINIKNTEKFKSITCQAFFRRFNYNNEQKIIPNTGFPQSGDFNGKEYKIAISSTLWQELWNNKNNKEYVNNFITSRQLLNNLPSITNERDFEIGNLSTPESAPNSIIIPFRLKSIYSNLGSKSEDFRLHVNISTNAYSLNSNKEQTLSIDRQNNLIPSIHNTTFSEDSTRYWIRNDECTAVITFIF